MIQRIDQQKIYLQLGYSSLFSFLTENIGYTPSAAQRRIEAARLITSVPEVKEDLKSGELNLSQALDLEVKQLEKKKTQADESVRLEITFSKEQVKLND